MSEKKTRRAKFKEKSINWVAPEENRKLASNTMSMVSEIFNSFKNNYKIKSNTPNRSIEDGKSFYNDFVMMQKINEKAMDESREKFVIESRIMYIAAAIGIFMTMYSFDSANPITIFTSIVITFMLLLSGYVRAFRASQIKHHSLFSFSFWIRMTDDWVV